MIINRAKYSLSFRFSLFDTDNYDTRQFIYERDLLYVYSIPAFYNTGVKYYILAKYNVSDSASLWVKFAQTKYFGSDTVGSGLEEINGNTKTDFNIQLQLKI